MVKLEIEKVKRHIIWNGGSIFFAGCEKGASTVTVKETYKLPSFIDVYDGLQFE